MARGAPTPAAELCQENPGTAADILPRRLPNCDEADATLLGSANLPLRPTKLRGENDGGQGVRYALADCGGAACNGGLGIAAAEVGRGVPMDEPNGPAPPDALLARPEDIVIADGGRGTCFLRRTGDFDSRSWRCISWLI
jgi:hypothetical protein